jgi:hypothetical protein
VYRDVEKIVEKPVDKIREVQVPVEVIKIVEVQKIVEKPVITEQVREVFVDRIVE